ncbi:MAG: HAMP domain-containing protein [Actinophytocola sp.]|nr:HAMP domain-containing protein [Actinophytocola sp.]
MNPGGGWDEFLSRCQHNAAHPRYASHRSLACGQNIRSTSGCSREVTMEGSGTAPMGLLTHSRGPGTINARVLRIALVPSVALMVVGIGLSGYLALQGLSTRTFSDNVRASLDPTTHFIASVQDERRLTTLELVDKLKPDEGALADQRLKVDDALREMKDVTAELAETAPDELHGPLQDLNIAAAQVPQFRQRVDGGNADVQEVYDFYGDMIDLAGAGIQGIARSATDAEVGYEQMIGYDLFRSVEAQSRSHALVVRGIAQGLDLDEFHELAHQMGSYHEIAETLYPRMTPGEQKRYDALKESKAWKTLVYGDNDVMARGPGQHEVSFDLKAWQRSAKELSAGLLDLYASHSAHAANIGASSGNQVLTTSLIGGGTLLLVTAAALVFALRQSRGLIRRLTGLRDETLDLAGNRMPEVVDRLGDGEPIDIDADVPWLDYGYDEIGQVADAFNQAQRLAIAATVQEAETRAGVRAVFLNMAQRNQVTAHRQLQVLDKAERSQEDPEQLQLLFELDHLATQGRRNAESLIILGGRQPGRQWRKPVALRDVIDGAIAETAQYTKVHVSRVADAALRGEAVADMIHMLAELLDNATSFSPPQTDVDVRAAVVGRGVVIEIEDQGLGIEPDQLEQINIMMHDAPDFSVMSLSEGTKIGLFVVSQLAARHEVRITLRESLYGGVNAIVLIPNRALATEAVDGEPPENEPYPGERSGDAELPMPSPSPRSAHPPREPAYPPREPAHPPREPAHPPSEPEQLFTHTPEPPATRAPTSPGGTGNDTVTITVNSSVLSNGNGSSHGNGSGSSSHPEPAPSPGTSDRPPLPRRRRHENLAPQLQQSEEPEPTPPAEPEPTTRTMPSAGRSPESFQATMSAFQRGTRRARADGPDTTHPPRWPGDDTA